MVFLEVDRTRLGNVVMHQHYNMELYIAQGWFESGGTYILVIFGACQLIWYLDTYDVRIKSFNKVDTSNHDQQIVARRSRRLNFLDLCHNTSQLHCIQPGPSQVVRYSPCHHLDASILWILGVQPLFEPWLRPRISLVILLLLKHQTCLREFPGQHHQVQHILVSVS